MEVERSATTARRLLAGGERGATTPAATERSFPFDWSRARANARDVGRKNAAVTVGLETLRCDCDAPGALCSNERGEKHTVGGGFAG